jgi:hypothetical protein
MSGSYSSRPSNPPTQPSSESYSQKRSSSYRRPVDAQPAPTHAPPPPATSNGTPSNSARPVVAAAAAAQTAVSRSSSHRRRQSQHLPPTAASTNDEPLPAAPDVPRAPPPTSYRDPYAPKGSSRSHGVARTYSGRSRDPAIHTNASRQQPNVQIAPNRLQELRAEPLSGTVQGQGRSTSVPDRSPLQKLEGKLDDISKEEKRARMLELELAAQESAEAESRARRVREAAAKQQRIVSGPGPSSASRAPDLGPVRTVSARRNVSMPVQPKPMSPDTAELDDGILYDLSEPWNPSLGAGPKTPQPPPELQLPSSVTIRQKNRLSYVEDYVGRSNSVKGKESASGSRRSGSFRARVGPDVQEQDTQRVEGKTAATPTGLGLYGVEGAPDAGGSRQNSKRISKDLPPAPRDLPPVNGSGRDSRGIQAAQMEMKRELLDQKNSTGPLYQARSRDTAASAVPASNKRHSVGFALDSEADDEPLQESPDVHHHFNVFSNHEPDRRYAAPLMLEEWRNALVAVLGGEDLDLDAPIRSDNVKQTWWEDNSNTRPRRSREQTQPSYDGYADELSGQTTFSPPLYLKCGPLLRYTGLRRDKSIPEKEREIWRGSVMIVTVDGQSSYQKPPTLRLFKQHMDLLPPPPTEIDAEGQPLNPDYVDPIEGQIKVSRSGKALYVKPVDEIAENEDLSRLEDDNGLFKEMPSIGSASYKAPRVRKKDGEKLGKFREIPAVRLHAERGVTFWRFNLEVELGATQARVAYRINRGPAIGFWVPAQGETMNMMFHSCNGFSLSVDSKQFCGPDPMWRDVLNNHQTRPFHVMIGGGDQIYNDAAMRQTTLFRQWTESRNALQKHRASFSSELQDELEQFYLDRYSMWFSQGLFGMANSQIPMVNIWDDHDIIDVSRIDHYVWSLLNLSRAMDHILTTSCPPQSSQVLEQSHSSITCSSNINRWLQKPKRLSLHGFWAHILDHTSRSNLAVCSHS